MVKHMLTGPFASLSCPKPTTTRESQYPSSSTNLGLHDDPKKTKPRALTSIMMKGELRGSPRGTGFRGYDRPWHSGLRAIKDLG